MKLETINPGKDGFLLLFQVENENFGIPLEQVLEVIIPPRLIRIPGDPDMAEGIIGYRGDAFTVIRIQSPAENRSGSKSKEPPSPEGKYELEEKIILLNPAPVWGGTMRIALRADRVRGVFRREESLLGKTSFESRVSGFGLNQKNQKSLEFKDVRGGSIVADLLNLDEFRRKIVSSFGSRVSS